MKTRIEGRYGRYANSGDWETLLRLSSSSLPDEGIAVQDVQGVQVYVKPRNPVGARSRKHRVYAICPCGRHIPVGRLHQHICKGV